MQHCFNYERCRSSQDQGKAPQKWSNWLTQRVMPISYIHKHRFFVFRTTWGNEFGRYNLRSPKQGMASTVSKHMDEYVFASFDLVDSSCVGPINLICWWHVTWGLLHGLTEHLETIGNALWRTPTSALIDSMCRALGLDGNGCHKEPKQKNDQSSHPLSNRTRMET